MTAEQTLFYAAGQIAYSLAAADGKIQREEVDAVNRFITNETEKTFSADYADIIFHILQKDHTDVMTALQWAKDSIRSSRPWLTKDYREKFCTLIDTIVAAYPPVTTEEINLVTTYKSLLTS